MKLFPQNISSYGNEIDWLFALISILVLFALILSLVILIYPMVKYRFRENVKAKYITGNSWKQLKWVVFLMILLALGDFLILFAEHSTWNKIEGELPKADINVVITGKQWNWMFTYPGPDNVLYTDDDVLIDQPNSELHVPVNSIIVFDLKATDVVHSFFVTNLRLKQDAIPGRTIKRWFNAKIEGKYELGCAELCGILHSRMRNFLVVESKEKYDLFTQKLYSGNEFNK